MWRVLEEWIVETYGFGGSFTNRDVAEGLDITNAQASMLIQSHLDAQRAAEPLTMYVLHRDGRTSAAVWTAGISTADARAVSQQFVNDVQRTVRRAFAPDLLRIAALNPRAARRCEAWIDAVAVNAMQVLSIAVGIELESGDE